MDSLGLKKRRILILAVLLLVAVFFWRVKFFNADLSPAVAPSISTGEHFGLTPQSPGFGFSDGGAQGYQNPLAGYPDPKNFAKFTYEIGSLQRIKRTERCNDAYYAILVFPQGVDYRKSVSSAVYNSASACKKGENIVIDQEVSAFGEKPGSYYYFIADEGDGIWYNPR